jgi:hypothetical protein
MAHHLCLQRVILLIQAVIWIGRVMIICLKNELFASFFELSLLTQLSVGYSMIEHVVEVEAMTVQKLDSVSIEMELALGLIS